MGFMPVSGRGSQAGLSLMINACGMNLIFASGTAANSGANIKSLYWNHMLIGGLADSNIRNKHDRNEMRMLE